MPNKCRIPYEQVRRTKLPKWDKKCSIQVQSYPTYVVCFHQKCSLSVLLHRSSHLTPFTHSNGFAQNSMIWSSGCLRLSHPNQKLLATLSYGTQKQFLLHILRTVTNSDHRVSSEWSDERRGYDSFFGIRSVSIYGNIGLCGTPHRMLIREGHSSNLHPFAESVSSTTEPTDVVLINKCVTFFIIFMRNANIYVPDRNWS